MGYVQRQPSKDVFLQAVATLARIGPSGVFDCVNLDLHRTCGLASPADAVHGLFGSIEAFGNNVHSRLFPNDRRTLSKQYSEYLNMVGHLCNNPDPKWWALLTMRTAARDAITARICRTDTPLQPKQKPTVTPPASVTMPTEVIENARPAASASPSSTAVPRSGLRAVKPANRGTVPTERPRPDPAVQEPPA